MTIDLLPMAPSARDRYLDIGAFRREGYPWLQYSNHPRWALQQAGWPSLTPAEARDLCATNPGDTP